MKKKNLLIISLLTLVLVLSVGYAAFARNIKITGTSTLSKQWEIGIYSITSNYNRNTTNQVVGTCEYDYNSLSTTANLSANLTAPGDSCTYIITIKNNGTLTAKPETALIQTNTVNQNLNATTSTLSSNLMPGGMQSYTVTISYNKNAINADATTASYTWVETYKQS